MFKCSWIAYIFVLLFSGCSGSGGGGSSSPVAPVGGGNGSDSNKVQKVSRCEALDLGSKCLENGMRDFSQFLEYEGGQSIKVRESEDRMIAVSADGKVRLQFAAPLIIPDFGVETDQTVDLVATKDSQPWFSFSMSTPRSYDKSDLKISYLNKSFGLSLANDIMYFTCPSGELYEVVNWVNASNECNRTETSPFANMSTFNFLDPNQCGTEIGLHVSHDEFWFLSIYNPMSQACR